VAEYEVCHLVSWFWQVVRDADLLMEIADSTVAFGLAFSAYHAVSRGPTEPICRQFPGERNRQTAVN
jgi:hypothetical protein